MKVLVIQEILPQYRQAFFHEIGSDDDLQLSLLTGPTQSEYGLVSKCQSYNLIEHKWVSILFKFKYNRLFFDTFKKNDLIIHVADFKFITLWLSLILCKFSNKRVFLHGQGGYKKKGLFQSLIYTIACMLADGYICYTEFSKKELLKRIPKPLGKRISVCENTLPIQGVKHVSSVASNHILYIGRLRENCGIELLLEAAKNTGLKIKVIGAGSNEYASKLREKYHPFAEFYGAVYDEDVQRKIAEGCLCGAYGGDAGLSVVHYLALGLPVIVHGDLNQHMGPEPSYIKHYKNGLFFERGSLASLIQCIEIMKNNQSLQLKMSKNALEKFNGLNKVSMAKKFLSIIKKRL